MSRFIRLLLNSVPVLLLIACAMGAASRPAASGGATQGWTEANRVAWYTVSQGSRLIPQAWMNNLEQPDGPGIFLDPGYINKNFRYLSNPAATWTSPDRNCPYDKSLPLGFSVDCQSDQSLSGQLRWKTNQSDREAWVGMNCSACHTAEMTFKGTTFRADGGPALADFQTFIEKLNLAVQNTVTDQAKFDRFASKVLSATAPPTDRTMLKKALVKWTEWNNDLATLNDPNHDNPATRMPAYGFGRLDAIGHIYNKISLLATPGGIAHQNANVSDAPTSYPFLWNVRQLDRVEWNGIAVNSVAAGVHYGALGRNAGEVIGVFGDVSIKKSPGRLEGYNSSVAVRTLNDIEAQIARLQPPIWPAAFGKVDRDLAAAGGKLFAANCSGCHTVPTRPAGDLTETFKTKLQPVFPVAGTNEHGTGTDFWMACNAVLDSARSGLFSGNKSQVITGAPIADPAPNLVLLTNAVTGVLIANKWAIGKMVIFHSEGLPPPAEINLGAGVDQKRNRADACMNFKDDPKDPKMVYKGRPLQGIWATAPYLHNGSVPNLWEMLLPAAERSKIFYMGTREFDPVNVGYQTNESADNSFKFDTSLAGNSNSGHDYGNAKLSPDDRKALVEYMKTF
jgi:mono/diheme cytochrome c family protein